jgi:succinate-acetate transporter protein
MYFNYGMFHILQYIPNKELLYSSVLSDLNILENWKPNMLRMKVRKYLILWAVFAYLHLGQG